MALLSSLFDRFRSVGKAPAAPTEPQAQARARAPRVDAVALAATRAEADPQGERSEQPDGPEGVVAPAEVDRAEAADASATHHVNEPPGAGEPEMIQPETMQHDAEPAAPRSPFAELDAQPEAPSAPGESVDVSALHEKVIATLREIYDPEIPVNIYDLGLIYRVDVSPGGGVDIDMTLTTPGCPVAATFPGTVESMVSNIPEVIGAHVELVWDPPWTMDRMPEEVKLELGLL